MWLGKKSIRRSHLPHEIAPEVERHSGWRRVRNKGGRLAGLIDDVATLSHLPRLLSGSGVAEGVNKSLSRSRVHAQRANARRTAQLAMAGKGGGGAAEPYGTASLVNPLYGARFFHRGTEYMSTCFLLPRGFVTPLPFSLLQRLEHRALL